MATTLIKNARIVNEGKITEANLFIKDGIIMSIGASAPLADTVIDAAGKYLIPGVIDDQVHFREPGLTHKANIQTESKAAVAGGTTTFMEMPNTSPPVFTQELLEDKYQIAAKTSLANYSFYMGASNDNLEEVLKTDKKNVCGIKIFMGSSTGNLLVDKPKVLEMYFKEVDLIIATHCEDEASIKHNEALYREQFGENIPFHLHPIVRDEKACLLSSSLAVELAKKHNTRLHILHISTENELSLFRNDIPLEQKRITSEVCVHHLWFSANDYQTLGAQIKCNPAIKDVHHTTAIREGLRNGYLDIIATDHAPHTWEEKQQQSYFKAPSGLPLVQHSLSMMLDFVHQGIYSLEFIVEKMCHAPAICFQVEKRGFIREGYYADLVLIDTNATSVLTKESIYHKCQWSPLEGHRFMSQVTDTFINGRQVYSNGKFDESVMGQRLTFNR